MTEARTKRLQTLLLESYNQNVTIKYFYFAKLVLSSLFIWKILSRDFSNFGLWPQSVLAGYPYDIYPPDATLIMGIPGIFDLATFHWIHYFISWPSVVAFQVLQLLVIIALVLFAFCSIRLTRIFAVLSYIPIMYLWGFLFRLGMDIDAVFLLQMVLLNFVILKPGEKENHDIYFKNVYYSIKVIFVIYYFFSGLNKVIDLNYIEWFQFDLVRINQQFYNMYINEGLMYVPKLIDLGPGNDFFNYFGAIITYFVHFAAPLLLIGTSRFKILFYWLFYSIFHYMTMFVGIMFMMNFFAFILLIPIDKFLKKEVE